MLDELIDTLKVVFIVYNKLNNIIWFNLIDNSLYKPTNVDSNYGSKPMHLLTCEKLFCNYNKLEKMILIFGWSCSSISDKSDVEVLQLVLHVLYPSVIFLNFIINITFGTLIGCWQLNPRGYSWIHMRNAIEKELF